MTDRKETKRVEVGFAGGQAIALRISGSSYSDFRKALRGGDGWYELETDDGPITLNLTQVVFVKTDTGEHKIGFSGL